MTPAVFYILLALVDEDRHGYGIMKEIEERTNGEMQIRPGTLYQAIKRLLERNLITEAEEGVDLDLSDERRRYYHLTDFGQRVLSSELDRLEQMVRLGRASQGLRGTNLGESLQGVMG